MGGFAAASGNGSFVTKPIRWNSGELTINADTTTTIDSDYGWSRPSTREMMLSNAAIGSAVQISIAQAGQRRGPPSVPFRGNETNATVEWPGSGGVASAAGELIQLEVVLTGAARLYSLRGDFAWH